jgi:rubrerythrin
MRTLLAVLAIGAVLSFAGGCKNDHDNDMDHDMHTQKMSSEDVCPHCPGVQHATADGKCPECGAKVSKM